MEGLNLNYHLINWTGFLIYLVYNIQGYFGSQEQTGLVLCYKIMLSSTSISEFERADLRRHFGSEMHERNPPVTPITDCTASPIA